MDYAEVARKAAEVMSERGHCKGILEDDEGRVCFNGAINYAVAGQHRWTNESLVASSLLVRTGATILHERGWEAAEHLPVYLRPHDPINFNNDPQTTGEDVILLLKECAKRLEGQRSELRSGLRGDRPEGRRDHVRTRVLQGCATGQRRASVLRRGNRLRRRWAHRLESTTPDGS